MKLEFTEKRKKVYKKTKNIIKNVDFQQQNAKNELDNGEIKLLAWIKTLLVIKRFLPNIICLVDKHILNMAQNSQTGSFIFGDVSQGTYGQVEAILNMEQRKMSLVNINLMIEEMLGSLDEKYKKFVYYKYFKNKNFVFCANELNIDERTAYRWHKLILIKLLKFCKLNNWKEDFFVAQLKDEKWILPHFEKSYKSISNIFAG